MPLNKENIFNENDLKNSNQQLSLTTNLGCSCQLSKSLFNDKRVIQYIRGLIFTSEFFFHRSKFSIFKNNFLPKSILIYHQYL